MGSLRTTEFVDRLKSRYVTVSPHREVAQQRGVVGRIDAEGYLLWASAWLGRDLKRLRETGRLYGQEWEDRNLLAYLLWERGAFTNEEIGGIFGMGYSAVSHLVKRMKGKLKEDEKYAKNGILSIHKTRCDPLIQMSIASGGGGACVAEEGLNMTKAQSLFEEMSCETMAKGMERDFF